MNRLLLCALIAAGVRFPGAVLRLLVLLVRVVVFTAGHVVPLAWLGIGACVLTSAVLLMLAVRQVGLRPRLVMETT